MNARDIVRDLERLGATTRVPSRSGEVEVEINGETFRLPHWRRRGKKSASRALVRFWRWARRA